MLSTILLRQINYSFARGLYRPALRKFFDRKPDNLYKAKQEMQKKLQVPPMPDNLFRKVFKQKPKIFVQNNKVHQRYENRVKLVKQLAQKYDLAKVMQTCIYSNRYILFKMTDQQLESLCKAIQQNYGFTPEQIRNIFSNYYRTINPKLLQMLDARIQLFRDYLYMSKQQTIQLFVKHHFLIPASLDRIKETILLLLSQSKSLGDEILSRDRIKQLLNQYPEVFILGRHQIKDLVDIYHEWGFDYKEVWQLILDSPILLNNYPYEIMPLKRRLFRYFRFTKEMGRLMVKKYPLALMSSVSSLQAKLIFIKDRLKLPINEQTLQLLQYKFSQIRPRGQLLVRAKQNLTLQNIIDFIKMSDQDFAKRLDIPLSRVQQENQRFKQTDELDWRRRKVLKGSGVQEKVRGIIKDLRGQLQTATVA